MRVFGNTGALCVKTGDRICIVVNHLKFAILVEKSISSLDMTVSRSLLIAKLPVISAKITVTNRWTCWITSE